jgi:hypothetical protein
LHNSTKAAHIVILKERRIRRELKDLDFPSVSMERRMRRYPSTAAQDDKIVNSPGYAKASLSDGQMTPTLKSLKTLKSLILFKFFFIHNSLRS